MDEIIIPEPPFIELPYFIGPDPNMVIDFPPIIFGPTLTTEGDLRMELTKEQQEELWRQAVHNKVFQLGQDCQDLRAALEILIPPEISIHDKFSVFERQLRVVECELRRLREYVAKLKLTI